MDILLSGLITVIVLSVAFLVGKMVIRRRVQRGGGHDYAGMPRGFTGEDEKEQLARAIRGEAPTFGVTRHDVMTGPDGPFHVGVITDYGPSFSSYGKSTSVHGETWSFLAIPVPLRALRTELKPEQGRPYDDVNTEWDAFNRAWDVTTARGIFANALLTGPMQQFLMTAVGNRIVITRGWIAVLWPGEQGSIPAREGLRIVYGIRANIPGFLWQELAM